eukprot:528372_1
MVDSIDGQLARMDINQLNKVISEQQIAMGKITKSNNQHVKILQSIESQQLNAIRRFSLECRQKIDIARAAQKKSKKMNDLLYAVHQSLLETAIVTRAAKEEESKNQQQSPFRFRGNNNHCNVAILGISNLDCDTKDTNMNDTNESPLIKEENEHEPPPQYNQYEVHSSTCSDSSTDSDSDSSTESDSDSSTESDSDSST